MVIKILSGLESNYKEISVVIRARDTLIFFEEFFHKLIDHETLLRRDRTNKEMTNTIHNLANTVASTIGPKETITTTITEKTMCLVTLSNDNTLKIITLAIPIGINQHQTKIEPRCNAKSMTNLVILQNSIGLDFLNN